ncbi:hypothetical protein TYRP_023410 [Tyrophagus putrescentiae]|nr:hypothetical protein TYRP_023410 [Tyrophagus putrescentiae]
MSKQIINKTFRIVVIQSAVVAVVLLKVARVGQRLIEDRLHLLDKVQAAVLIAGVEGRRVGERCQQLGAFLLLMSLVMADDFKVLLLFLLSLSLGCNSGHSQRR